MAKPKAAETSKPVLSIPVPHRLAGDVDAMLEATLQERFSNIILIKTSEEDIKKGTWVVKHAPSKDDPKVQVSEINPAIGHLSRFVMALANGWASGMGLSGDGSALYVAKYVGDVYKALPQLKEYDLFLQPAGRSGCSKYRIGFAEAVTQVTTRAKTISASLEKYGVMAGKERTRKSDAAPQITVEF
jgi:hypothetical protein